MENQAPLAGLDPADLLRQGAADDTFVDGAPSAFNPPPMEELAALFPQFEILELIGQGGMGAVYKVRQKDLDRIVALKILPPGIGQSPEFSSRFTREARALAKLNHPGIVILHEFGQQDGLYFILMEFVDGVNLAQLMKTGRISPREALAIVPQICDALQYAHDQGIVHRDIKPENILLDRTGRVKVADFGIAKVVAAVCERRTDEDDEVRRSQTDATLAGKIIGTPQYMAPEQIDHPSDVDHRADIYALGVVFYQMLTGELPGKDLQAPSKKFQIDVRLDEIVLKALEKNPDQRYQQASVMKTRVETLAGTGETASVPLRDKAIRWGIHLIWAACVSGLVTLAITFASEILTKDRGELDQSLMTWEDVYGPVITVLLGFGLLAIPIKAFRFASARVWIGSVFATAGISATTYVFAKPVGDPAFHANNFIVAVAICAFGAFLGGFAAVFGKGEHTGSRFSERQMPPVPHQTSPGKNPLMPSALKSLIGLLLVLCLLGSVVLPHFLDYSGQYWHTDEYVFTMPIQVDESETTKSLAEVISLYQGMTLKFDATNRKWKISAIDMDRRTAERKLDKARADIQRDYDEGKISKQAGPIVWQSRRSISAGVLPKIFLPAFGNHLKKSLSFGLLLSAVGMLCLLVRRERGRFQFRNPGKMVLVLVILVCFSCLFVPGPYQSPLGFLLFGGALMGVSVIAVALGGRLMRFESWMAVGIWISAVVSLVADLPNWDSRQDPGWKEVILRASRDSDRMRPVTVDAGPSDKTSGMLTASKLADYPWDELPADTREGGGVRVSSDGLTCLKIENPSDVALNTRLLTIVTPPVKARQYAVMGEIRYENVEGAAYLEMWSEFPQGRFFSRTLDEPESGAMGRITGTSDWRPFILPFDQMGIASPPSRIEVNLRLPGGGVVFVGPLRLCELATVEVAADLAQIPPVKMDATASSVMVSGEVRKAGSVRVETSASLLDVLAAAGGWTEKADLASIRLRMPEESEAQTIDLSAILRGEAVNPLVPPGAIVEIREK